MTGKGLKESLMNNYSILHLRASNFYGGPERQLHFHARLAKEAGVNIVVASFSEKKQMPEFIKIIADDNIPTYIFEVKNAYDFSVIHQLGNFLKEHDIDILCTHDYRTHLIGMLARGKHRLRWMAFSRGWTQENIKIKFYNTLDKIFIRQADRIVAVSEAQKKKLRRLLIPSSKISVVYNAIDETYFKNISQVNLRERFNFPQEAVICISGGRFSKEKGQIYFVKAAINVLKENKRFRFILFGEGPDLMGIKELIKKEGYEKEIICPGFEKNLIGCLKGADILVNPSLSEGLPNIILEALAMEVPVIATDVGGVPEIITDGVNGSLVPAKDIEGLKNKIVAIADDKITREKFVNNGKRTLKDKFSFSLQVEKLLAIYKKVLSI